MLLIFSSTSPSRSLLPSTPDSEFYFHVKIFFFLFAGKCNTTTERCSEHIRKHTICDKSFRYVTNTKPVYTCRISSQPLFASPRRVKRPRSQVQVLFDFQIFSYRKWTLKDFLSASEATNFFLLCDIFQANWTPKQKNRLQNFFQAQLNLEKKKFLTQKYFSSSSELPNFFYSEIISKRNWTLEIFS